MQARAADFSSTSMVATPEFVGLDLYGKSRSLRLTSKKRRPLRSLSDDPPIPFWSMPLPDSDDRLRLPGIEKPQLWFGSGQNFGSPVLGHLKSGDESVCSEGASLQLWFAHHQFIYLRRLAG